MKKAYYIDSFSIGHVHEMFDASSLEMFSHNYDKIEYRSSISSKNNVEKIMGILPSSVRYKRILIPRKVDKIGLVLRQIVATVYNFLYVVFKSRQYDIIINYNTLLSIYPVKFACKFASHKVFIICHGELKELELHSNVNCLTKKSLDFFIKKGNNIPRNLYFFTLSKSINENVSKLVTPQIAEKFCYFYHSAIFKQTVNKKERKLYKKIIGMTGSLRESKGFMDFLAIASHFKSNQNVEFRAIGALKTDVNIIKESGVVLPECVKEDTFLSREEMYTEISKLDYVLYLFPPEIYKYTASGSVYDAIDCEVPIIALRNDFFNDLFEYCGKFGFLFDTKEDIVDFIEKLDTIDEKIDFRNIKEKLSPKQVSSLLTKQNL